MIYFNCDYNEGAYPAILQKLGETNLKQTIGYGEDEYCEAARTLIKNECKAENAQVHFLVGGTQTNLTLLSAALRPHQGVIAASTGHINVHETGAIEAGGHKVLSISSNDGRITGDAVRALCAAHYADEAHEHMVMPKVAYISSPTELGTVYSRAALNDLRSACDEYGLYLYLDGARLGYGLMAAENDIDLPTLARVCDAFYIGGTKQGALFGEALVISNDELKRDFRYILKQKGGMLAKGRLLGLQFTELFCGNAYFDLAKHADELANRLRAAFVAKGYGFLVQSGTNQVFVILPDDALEKLGEKYVYSYECRVDERTSAVRFCTSWATREADVDELVKDIGRL